MHQETFQLILRRGAENLLTELHDELARKTLALWNSQSGKTYGHYVPWMSCLPDPDHGATDHPALSDVYDRGSLPRSAEQLHNINEYLRLPQARPIITDIYKNLPEKYAGLPLAQEEIGERLMSAFATSKEALLASHPSFAILFDRLVHVVIPIQMSEAKMNESLDLARGAVFMSFFEPLDLWEIQVNLAHEFGHQALMIVNSADPLFNSDITTPVFSGVRLTERPAIQSLHAAIALAFMTLFTRKKSDNLAQESTATFVRQLRRTLDSLRENCSMTQVGSAILADCQELCEECGAELSI